MTDKEPIDLQLRRQLKLMGQANRFMAACRMAEREERRRKIIKFPTKAERDGRA